MGDHGGTTKTVDDCYAVCPSCGYRHGDCWEWVTEYPKEHECHGCGARLVVVADVAVTYTTTLDAEEVAP